MYAIQKMISTVSSAEVRAINRMAALELVRSSGPISRTEIAGYLHISLPTAIRIVNELIASELLRPANEKASSGGRRRDLIEFNGAAHLVLGVDLGGTKIFGAVANLNGEILYETHFNHHQTQAEESFQVLCESIQNLLAFAKGTGLQIRGIAVGVPGAAQPETGVITNAPSLGWSEFPLKARLSERFAYPLAVENDVNLAVLGEFWFGTEPGVENLVLLAIGTGIGAGLVINGMVHTGAHAMAGEVGYLLPEAGCLRQIYPGFGAFEQLASGTGIAERARQALAKQWNEEQLAALTAEEVFNAAREGQPWASKIVDETVDYLAQAVANITLVMDPDLILFGGGVSRSADLFIGPIQERLEGVIPIRPKMAVSRLGYRAGILGGVARLLRSTAGYYLLQKYA